jgi:hypothetical protein
MRDKKILFQSVRRFEVISFEGQRGSLLLRSRKSNEHETRVDVLILDVRAMEMRCEFDGIRVEEVDRSYLDGFRSNPSDTLEPGHRVYSVTGGGWQGYTVGGPVFIHEDDKEYMAPSALLESS